MATSNSNRLPLGVVIVGCGGVASYLLPCLLRTFQCPKVSLHDGDTLETRNLDRQLFSADHIGMNKAQALSELLAPQFPHVSFEVHPEYFHEGTPVPYNSIIIACVDNHTARRNILDVADRNGCVVILAANEYTDSSAAVYYSSWKGSPLDPRVRYPEILTDRRDDPRRPESCQGELQQAHPQLAMANFGAANHALWLLWYHRVEIPHLDPTIARSFSPVEHSNNFSRTRTTLNGELLSATKAA